MAIHCLMENIMKWIYFCFLISVHTGKLDRTNSKGREDQTKILQLFFYIHLQFAR